MEKDRAGRLPRPLGVAGGARLRPWAAALVLSMLVMAQPAGALPGAIVIPYGRSWPLSLAVDQSGGLVYFDASSGIYPPTGFSFGVINITSHSVTEVLPLGVVPGDVVFDAGRDRVYVAGSDSVEVFYGGTRTFIGNLSIGLPITHAAFDAAASGGLYLTSGGRVYEVDPTTGSVIANASVGSGAGSLVLDSGNGRLYVADYLLGAISVFTASLSPVGTIRLPSCCPGQLALDPDSQTLYATTGSNYIDVINARTDTFVRSVAVASSTENSTAGLAVDGITGRVFVSFSTGGSIAELGPNGQVLGFLKVASEPGGMAVDPLTGELYVTNYHQVTVLDARGGGPVPDYGWAALAALGAAAAAAVLVLALRSRAWRERARPAGR